MESFFFSLRATVPVFFLMLLGWFFARIGLIDAHFCKIADRLVFKVTLPVMLFCDMAKTDLHHDFDWHYVLFCALATTLIFFSIWIAAKIFIRDTSLIGEFVQVSYRSSAAILGVAIINSVY
ncbi:MAG: AEC family transporter, partial [Evtepia sp.]